MLYSEKGNPWEFDTTYYVNSHQIEFKELRNFGIEGPICGQLYIDNQKINCPEKCDGFGGPVLITSKRIYIPVYQKKICLMDIWGALVAEIDLCKLSVRLIGKKQGIIYIKYLENERLYFCDSYKNANQNKNIKYVNTKEDYKLWTLMDKLSYIYSFLKNI